MANTFFGFDTSLNNESDLLPDDDADLGEGGEDEYDALNDETFGSALNDDDWEVQHEQFAHDDENSKQSERIENSIKELVLNDSDDEAKKTFESINKHIRTPGLIEKLTQKALYDLGFTKHQNVRQSQPRHQQQQQQQPKRLLPPGLMVPPHARMQRSNMPPIPQQLQPPPRLPPGLHHQMHGNQPPARLPPGFPPCMPPMPMPGRQQSYPPMPPMLRPGMPMPRGVNPPMPPQYGNFPNFPMPPTIHNNPPMPPHVQQQQQHIRQQQRHNLMQQLQMHAQHELHQRQQPMPPPPQQQQHDRAPPKDGMHRQSQPVRDEYAGLMTTREKQWLLNIQQMQLNTGTPYFDDYYYTVFKERKARTDKENQPLHQLQMLERRHQPHQQQQRNRQDRQENSLPARVYTPQQFENSLGKLQCVSVTAPRKIIDTDVVTLEKDSEYTPTRDTRKTKQLLLELESLYSLVLKVEDLMNPTAIANVEKLFEIKQKQRLREMEAAATSEQKQELLRLLQDESRPPRENPVEYLMKIMATVLQDDKFASFLNIRKGKMLLLRLLPLLGSDFSIEEYASLWSKVLLCIPLVGRRDMAGDNLLPRLHPYFKRFVQTSRMHDIIGIVNKLEQTIRPTDSRCTPLSHQSKPPLQFVVGNKFGVSALVTILVRTEYLISSGNANEEQLDEWLNFLQNWAEATSGRVQCASPLELIPRPVFIKHANRFVRLSEEKRQQLEKHYVDIN